MTMEELARQIAEERGRDAVTEGGCWLYLERDLIRHDLPHQDSDIQRLEDMITNLLDEAWRERPPLRATDRMMERVMAVDCMVYETVAREIVQAVIEEINNGG